jgi:hypothetical protein
MDNVFKHLFERDLGDEPSDKRKKAEEFHATGEFLPDDPNYDPQLRLKKRLRLLFPHLPTLPGLPPKTQDD